MLNKLLLAALTALLVPACLDDAAPVDTDESVVTEPTDLEAEGTSEDGNRHDDNERALDLDTRPLCERTIETEGACANACDHEAVMSFVPEGTCALIPCVLEDGSRYNIGGCNR